MRDVTTNPALVAYCGLYCGACRRFLRKRCPGCKENQKATWCKVRSCCISNQYASCADCQQFVDPNDCKMFNNWISKIFGLVFRSDRAACIRQIREIGVKEHAADMAGKRLQSIKK